MKSRKVIFRTVLPTFQLLLRKFSSARWLEILFMKNLHSKVEVTCSWQACEYPLCKWIVPEVTFQEYVRIMRQDFEGKKEEEMEMGVLFNEQEELES